MSEVFVFSVVDFIVKCDVILVVDDEWLIFDMFLVVFEMQFDVVMVILVCEVEFVLCKKMFKVVVVDYLMLGGNGMSFLVCCCEEYLYMQCVLVIGYMKLEMLLCSVNEVVLYCYFLKLVQMMDLLWIVQDVVCVYDVVVKMV